jgi:hypothetical protein
MTALLSQNAKMKKSGGDKYAIFDFAIPAYKSNTGLVTCPMAGSCAKGCYAQQGTYAWQSTQDAFERRLATITDGTFAGKIEREIRTKLKTATRRKQQLVIRVHSSGDFFSPDYVNTWFKVVALFPEVQFYAYTKALPFFKNKPVPSNFTVIFSEGGKFDKAIDIDTERHARVFDSNEALEAAGYDNAMDDDSVAFTSKSGKIGLVYHGAKSKAWETGA